MSWNKRIKDLRIDHDMGKKELANKLDISERTLTRYESGISEPTISVLIKLSLLFNVSIDYIAGIKDEEAILTPSIKEELEAINKRLDKIVKITSKYKSSISSTSLLFNSTFIKSVE